MIKTIMMYDCNRHFIMATFSYMPDKREHFHMVSIASIKPTKLLLLKQIN